MVEYIEEQNVNDERAKNHNVSDTYSDFIPPQGRVARTLGHN